MIKIFNDILQVDVFWCHMGYVFIKYFHPMRKKLFQKTKKLNIRNILVKQKS